MRPFSPLFDPRQVEGRLADAPLAIPPGEGGEGSLAGEEGENPLAFPPENDCYVDGSGSAELGARERGDGSQGAATQVAATAGLVLRVKMEPE
jgi:hypothetical protein